MIKFHAIQFTFSKHKNFIMQFFSLVVLTIFIVLVAKENIIVNPVLAIPTGAPTIVV